MHSIEEDRAHRRRVATSTAITIGTFAVLVVVAVLGSTDGPYGRFVRVPVLQAIQAVALVLLVAVLGPAIRRFGRGYANDLWPATPVMASALLKLLDVAYVLVFAGYILMTGELDLRTSDIGGRDCRLASVNCAQYLPDELLYTAFRIGGLLLLMGLLHALTIIVLPVVALVSNSTRRGQPLPRWLVVVSVIIGGGVGFLAVLAVIAALVGVAGG